MPEQRPPVFLPHNEPHLGHPTLLEFDLAIPPAMQINTRVAQNTFHRELAPLQKAAVQLIPQAVSIALSIRELIRQGYLYSGALLLRPLIERVGLVEYLRIHPDAVRAWHDGWPRKDQPSFQTLLETSSQIKAASAEELQFMSKVMHKLIHPDPAGAFWNMITREDGAPAFSSGKVFDNPDLCEFVSLVASRFLTLVIRMAEDIFESDRNGA